MARTLISHLPQNRLAIHGRATSQPPHPTAWRGCAWINISPDSHLIAHLRLPHAQTGYLVPMHTRNVVSPSEPFMILMPVRAPLRFSISHSVQRSKTCPIDAERLVTHSLLTDIALAAIPQQRSKATCPS